MKRRLNRRQINGIVRKYNGWKDVSSKYTWDKICDTLDVSDMLQRLKQLGSILTDRIFCFIESSFRN